MKHGMGGMSRRRFLALGSALGASVFSGCGSTGGAPAPGAAGWGSEGTRDGSFLRPRAIGTHGGEIFVIDMSGRVQVFDAAGKFLRMWEMPQHDNGTPTAIHLEDDRVLIPDTHYSRVIEYTPAGEERRRWGSFGSGPDQFIYPTGVAVGSDGTYYLSEYGQEAERIHVFSADSAFLRQWGSHGEAPGQFSRAMGLVLGQNGDIYVADTANHRVQVFSTDGKLLNAFGNDPAKGPPLKYPHDIACGPDGTLYLAEYGTHRISRYAPDGRFITAYGRAGRGPGEFNAPRGVAVDAEGVVYVADTDNHRVQFFNPGGAA